MIRLALWVEGPTDASTLRLDGEERAEDVPAGGALVPLVRKALGDDAPTEAQIVARRLTGRVRDVVSLGAEDRRRKLSSRLTKKGWKVLAAIDQARAREPATAVVAVWDRDGEDEPLRDRDVIHDTLHARGSLGACVGICVEEVEAWLLADPGAFRRCFGRGPERGLPGDPEADPDPKETLVAVLPGGTEERRAATYRRLADEVDLALLERRCPKGFGELRRVLDAFVRPWLRAHP